MSKPNTLLKVVSIIYIVVEILAAITGIITALGAGLLLGFGFSSSGFGIGMGALILLFTAATVALGLIAGILGLKANNLKACKVFGIILIVLAAIDFLSAMVSGGSGFLMDAAQLVLPILYLVGVSKEIDIVEGRGGQYPPGGDY